jgi:four helix bundle protein
MAEVKKYLQLRNLGCYKRAFELSNYVWEIVITWDYFSKQTVGIQFVRAIDSISANIAEGFGRYGKKDKIKFYYYSFGSVKEASDWNEKGRVRKIMSQEQYEYILHELQELPRELHHLIKFTNEKLQQ